MSKAIVNMTPNPLDIQTIHCSQGDTEAREWGFELHNNGEKIDSSSISDQLVFKACEGGTEEILPTNGSVPTTSPFLGDIRYPQGLLTDQEFTYRQSPTESDGLAKITDIKGNTIVWNQLVQNGNFADTSTWSAESGATLSISNNIATIASTTANNGIKQYFPNPLTVGHKYLIKAEFNVPTEYRCVIGTVANQGVQVDKLISTANTWTEVIGIGTCTVAATSFYCYVRGSTTYENVKVRNVMCVDLTEMFGAGNEPTTVEEFTSLFPLSYYSYNQGSLLSFNGNGIKTVGKNLFKPKATYSVNGITFTNANGVISINGTATANAYFATNIGLPNDLYFICAFNEEINTNVHVAVQTKSGAYPADGTLNAKNRVLSVNTDIDKFLIYVVNGATFNNFVLKPMISFESPEYFEPYIESTTDLPISTYFPTGMKSAGTVYDELTPRKAITRIGAVDLGSLEWTFSPAAVSSQYRMISNGISSLVNRTTEGRMNIICEKYDTETATETYQSKTGIAIDGGGNILVYDPNYNQASSTSAFKTTMNGVYLYYELSTPTETSFTTASLVTENAEIPLSNNDGVLIGRCTEQLSAEPGFHDAKIKLSDSDGECYSNKIQLHIERSPQ